MAIVTISRGTHTGGELLAEHLGATLGYKIISREVIVEAARSYAVSEARLLEGMKSPPGLWQRLTHQKERYILAVQATLAEMIEEAGGNAIYHGFGGQHLLRPLSRVIKLKLIAPIQYRVETAMIELDLSHEEALKHILTVDDRRARWTRLLYNLDWTDPCLYDLVVNLEHLSIESAAEVVIELLGRREFRSTPESDQELRDFTLATRVRASLVLKSDFHEGVDVDVQQGVVQLAGRQFDRNRKAVIAFVKTIKGVEAVVPDDEFAEPIAASLPGEKKASEVMVPITGYPHIHKWTTLREAIVALSASSVKLGDGHLVSPRYVLVLDEADRLVGVISRRDLLAGLTPQLRQLEKLKREIDAIAPIASLTDLSFRWVSLFSPAALANALEPVESVMTPVRGTVNQDDDLSTVVTTMLQHHIDLVPVMDGERCVGVMLMTDVFDSVAEFIIEEGARQAKRRT